MGRAKKAREEARKKADQKEEARKKAQQKKMIITVVCIAAAVVAALLIFVLFQVLSGNGIQQTSDSDYQPPGAADQGQEQDQQNVESRGDLSELTANAVRATITMEDGGVIVLELYPDLAPQSVRNFVYLARQGFYDGLVFHRIMHGFMIQGGCPLREGFGGPGYNIKGEFSANGFENNLRHERGVLSMARSNAYDSAGSQFFIMHADNTGLDGLYAAFGRVTSGMDVVDRIAAVPAIDNNGTVLDENKPTITSITIDSDTELPEPDKLG